MTNASHARAVNEKVITVIENVFQSDQHEELICVRFITEDVSMNASMTLLDTTVPVESATV